MILKSLNFLLLILYFKLVYSVNLNYLYPDILKSDNDLIETEKIISQFVQDSEFEEELNNFKDNYNYSQITDKELFLDNYKNDTRTTMIKSFYLYTRDYHDGKDPEVLYPFNSSSLNDNHLKQKPTYILAHGFEGNGSEEWIINLKDALLKKGDYNILSFDWPGGKKTGNPQLDIFIYSKAVLGLPKVGNEASVFIESLIKQVDLTLDSVHCIGHSLGAHVCGFTGKPLKGRIGRITGLNPDIITYSYYTSQKLDKSDAVYVDIIFTDACGSSYCNIKGHSVFFPNGGVKQPGCPVLYKDNTECSSSMAYKYFIASVNSTQPSTDFLARPCENWQQCKLGNYSCGESVQVMGFYAKAELHGSFYLETLAKPPYTIQDTDCVIPNSIFQSTIVEIVGFVGMAIVIVALIIYILSQRCYRSPTNNEKDPLLDNKKASRSTDVV